MPFVSSRHIGALLTGFKFTSTSTPSAAINLGTADFPSVSRAAAGKVAATFHDIGVFKRGPIVVVTPGEDIANGGFGTIDTVPASGVITAECLGAAGSGDDGSGYALCLGFEEPDTDRYDASQRVRSSLVDPFLLGWYIANDGDISIVSGGSQASVARSAQGTVTISLSPALSKARAIAITCVNASYRGARVVSFDGSTISLVTFDETGTLQDTDFVVHALFSGLLDETGRARSLLQCPQLQGELVAGRITNNAGTPVIAIGGATNGVDFAVTDNGTGDWTVTLSNAFGRAVLPVVSSLGSRVWLADLDENSFQLKVANASAVAADDSVDFILLGYDGNSGQEF